MQRRKFARSATELELMSDYTRAEEEEEEEEQEEEEEE